MHEEVNYKTIALVIRSEKIIKYVFLKAIKSFLDRNKNKNKVKNNKINQGKMSYKSLAKKDAALQTIEITDKNIKSFSKIAKKYKIDFALKKDNSETPPKHIVFFKTRDVEVLNRAFGEFTKKSLTKKNQ